MQPINLFSTLTLLGVLFLSGFQMDPISETQTVEPGHF